MIDLKGDTLIPVMLRLQWVAMEITPNRAMSNKQIQIQIQNC